MKNKFWSGFSVGFYIGIILVIILVTYFNQGCPMFSFFEQPYKIVYPVCLHDGQEEGWFEHGVAVYDQDGSLLEYSSELEGDVRLYDIEVGEFQ